ncbi:MAG: S-layer homology domain-containing protein [bacterium]|nr:S-layer homology domain-containing protein [Acidimicrobiia bacterium]MCY4650255.1 S-layer homology domain-containing protein [bacterium]
MRRRRGRSVITVAVTAVAAAAIGLLVGVPTIFSQTAPEFEDVPEGHVAAVAIDWAAENGITSGVGNNRFGVGQTLDRYQMVTFLCRAYDPGNCRSSRGSDRFVDVPADHWADYSVGWAVNRGITSGVSATEFGGPRTLTREQMMTLMYRASGSPTGGSVGSAVYGDLPADRSHWANVPIGWAFDQGITGGIAPGVFGFGANVSREEMVLFLCRALAPDTCRPSQAPLPSSVVPTATISGEGAGSVASEVAESVGGVELEVRLANESDGGVSYSRSLYGSWTRVRSQCNTRCAVLEEEQRPDGTWFSWYDGRTISNSSELDIDHMVPLAEAHSSGGWRWDALRKRQYANDIAHPEALTAVSASSNRSKGSRDPAEWKPSDQDAWCDYAIDWITVKTVWNLTSDRAEITGLEVMLGTCDHPVTLHTTTVAATGDTAGSGADTDGARTASQACPYTSAVGDPCEEIPALGNTSNDVNCGDIPRRYKPLTVVGRDYDRLDGNNDGEACTP